MPEAASIQCPHCQKRFKGNSDLIGKKIRCPLCQEPFTAGASAAIQVKAPRGVKKTPQPAAPVPASAVPAVPAEDNSVGQYGLKEIDLTPRCPNCAKEMPNEKAHICIHCGYNSLTRERGTTVKTYAVSIEEHLQHLLPGLCGLAFLLFSVIGMIYFCLVWPTTLGKSWWSWTDHESIRMWFMMIVLALMFSIGTFTVRRLILEPLPKERKKE